MFEVRVVLQGYRGVLRKGHVETARRVVVDVG
jgi:hypothetical protein